MSASNAMWQQNCYNNAINKTTIHKAAGLMEDKVTKSGLQRVLKSLSLLECTGISLAFKCQGGRVCYLRL